MKNATMTNEQKKELILNGTNDAYHKLITSNNYQFFSDAFFIAEQAAMEITGIYSSKNSMIAQKHVLLRMLSLNLL